MRPADRLVFGRDAGPVRPPPPPDVHLGRTDWSRSLPGVLAAAWAGRERAARLAVRHGGVHPCVDEPLRGAVDGALCRVFRRLRRANHHRHLAVRRPDGDAGVHSGDLAADLRQHAGLHAGPAQTAAYARVRRRWRRSRGKPRRCCITTHLHPDAKIPLSAATGERRPPRLGPWPGVARHFQHVRQSGLPRPVLRSPDICRHLRDDRHLLGYLCPDLFLGPGR